MKTRILLIEDNEQNRYLATFLLEQRGFEVVHAPDGPRGIELAASVQPALILLDIQLPGMDGSQKQSNLQTQIGRIWFDIQASARAHSAPGQSI
jgi:CheY-like chemotaxis protein